MDNGFREGSFGISKALSQYDGSANPRNIADVMHGKLEEVLNNNSKLIKFDWKAVRKNYLKEMYAYSHSAYQQIDSSEGSTTPNDIILFFGAVHVLNKNLLESGCKLIEDNKHKKLIQRFLCMLSLLLNENNEEYTAYFVNGAPANHQWSNTRRCILKDKISKFNDGYNATTRSRREMSDASHSLSSQSFNDASLLTIDITKEVTPLVDEIDGHVNLKLEKIESDDGSKQEIRASQSCFSIISAKVANLWMCCCDCINNFVIDCK